jgi:hypothetical protein
MKTAGTLVAASIALGVAFGAPTIALAAPTGWDKQKYNQCLLDEMDQDWWDTASDIIGYCCAITGGDWDQDADKCVDPPAEGAEAPITLAPGIPTQVPTQTKAPAPAFPPRR